MSSTRGATASTASRAKKELVRVLFGKTPKKQSNLLSYTSNYVSRHSRTSDFPSKTGKAGTKIALFEDHSAYSYSQLKKAYLERLQMLHPDKNHHSRRRGKGNLQIHEKGTESNSHVVVVSQQHEEEIEQKRNGHELFVELQNAWNQYDQLAKQMKSVQKGDKTDANFTLFGVGCSFSDNDAERAMRDEITDQACRGWFYAGALGASNDGHLTETATKNNQSNSSRFNRTAGKKLESKPGHNKSIGSFSLIDDDMFEAITKNGSDTISVSSAASYHRSNHNHIETKRQSQTLKTRKTLVKMPRRRHPPT